MTTNEVAAKYYQSDRKLKVQCKTREGGSWMNVEEPTFIEKLLWRITPPPITYNLYYSNNGTVLAAKKGDLDDTVYQNRYKFLTSITPSEWNF